MRDTGLGWHQRCAGAGTTFGSSARHEPAARPRRDIEDEKRSSLLTDALDFTRHIAIMLESSMEGLPVGMAHMDMVTQ